MEVSVRRVLTTEEKPQASAADLAQWTTAKSRVNLILPKARDFIRRAAWTTGTPERQRLDEFFKTRMDFPLRFARWIKYWKNSNSYLKT